MTSFQNYFLYFRCEIQLFSLVLLGTLTLAKHGSATFDVSMLSDHMYQQWGYSWTTDEFYMNWAPCLEWYINEAEDSMHLNYDYQDYDPNSGNSFYWNYDLILTR